MEFGFNPALEEYNSDAAFNRDRYRTLSNKQKASLKRLIKSRDPSGAIDMILLHAGVRDAIILGTEVNGSNLTEAINNLQQTPLHQTSNAIDVMYELQLRTLLTNINKHTQSESETYHIEYSLSTCESRMEYIQQNHTGRGERVIGNFLGYPQDAIEAFVNDTSGKRIQNIREQIRETTPKKYNKYYALCPYIPKKSPENIKEAINIGHYYYSVCRTIADEFNYPKLEEIAIAEVTDFAKQ